MARKKRKKKKKSSDWFGFEMKTKVSSVTFDTSYRVFLIILAAGVCLSGVIFGFIKLDQYIQAVSPVSEKYGFVELIDKPGWFNSDLVRKVELAVGGEEFALDKTSARMVAENLKDLPWLYEVKTQTTNKSVQIRAQYRKPLALVKSSRKMYYISADLVVLDYVPISKLAIVEIKGASSPPPVGTVWDTDGIASAVELLKVLAKMDEISTPESPLLKEIASIETSNIGGRRSSRKPHIVMYANDGTQVFWGAAVGESSRYLEASDKEKLAMLYGFFKEHGSIQGRVKYIELRNPQKELPLPKR